MARNWEIKVRCPNLDPVRERAVALGARTCGTLEQVDTFYRASGARLKLRRLGSGQAELIGYRRSDCDDARPSEYFIARTDDPDALAQVLEYALGAVVVVRKRRELYLWRATRIHLDHVDRLGTFIELETVITGQSDDDATSELQELVRRLGLADLEPIACPYADLLSDAG